MIALLFLLIPIQGFAYEKCNPQITSKLDEGSNKYMHWNLTTPQIKGLENRGVFNTFFSFPVLVNTFKCHPERQRRIFTAKIPVPTRLDNKNKLLQYICWGLLSNPYGSHKSSPASSVTLADETDFCALSVFLSQKTPST